MKSKKTTSKKNDQDILGKKFALALGQLSGTMAIRDTPSFPLALNVRMPEGLEYRNGHLSFALHNFKCLGVNQVSLHRGKRAEKAVKNIFEISFEAIEVVGEYCIYSRYAPEVDMDTAGNMMQLHQQGRHPAPAGGDDTLNDDQKKAYLDQAREHRTRLMDTPNGQKVMEVYNEHNEIYDNAFKTDSLLRDHWKGDGTTGDMAADTSNALKTDSQVINQKDKTYKNGLSYNANAFTQQLNVAVSSALSDPDFNIFEPMTDNKYTQAAMAALSFGKSVGATGNDKKNTTELSASHVYQSVSSHDGTVPATTLDELSNVVAQGMGSGGAAENIQPGWLVLDEEDRAHLRKYVTAVLKEKEARKNHLATPLWQGACGAQIVGAAATVTLRGSKIDDYKIQIMLPAFDVHLDDSAWQGEAADVARQRLAQVYFIRSLIHDQVAGGIRERVITAFKTAMKSSATV